MNNNIILELKNITRNYPSPDKNIEINILNNISLSMKKGESIAIVGPSGSGKSTLLNIAGALDTEFSGKVFLGHKDITLMNKNELSQVRNKEIGFVFQLHHLLPQCSVIENVLLPSLPFPQKNSDEVYEYGVQMLERVGLQEHLRHRPGQLSVGEQQRVAVVRALINKPDILLADEPTGSLDNNSAENLINLLVELNKEYNLTLLMVTHAVDLANKMKKTYSLHNGTLKELK